MIRRSSTRGLPGLPRGRCGSIATHASLDNQNRCVIAASRLDEPSQKVESANKAIDCMGSLPRACTYKLCWSAGSNLAAVVRPVEQSLALPWPTHGIAGLAILLNLRDVSSDRLPALNLACVLGRCASPHVISAIPLKPAAWILGMYPSFLSPNREGLACVNAEVIEGAVAVGERQLSVRKPAGRKFIAAVRHVLAAEYAEGEHLLRRKLGAKFWIEIASDWFGEDVTISPLHRVVDIDVYG